MVGLLGFVLQVADAFPEHREVRKAILLLVLGFFVGSLVSSIRGEAITLNGSIAPSHLLVAISAVVPVLFSAWAAMLSDASKRQELFVVAFLGALIFVAVFAAVGLSGGVQEPELSFEESTSLAVAAEARGDYARAIELFEAAGVFINSDDPRKQSLDQRVERVKAAQAARALQ